MQNTKHANLHSTHAAGTHKRRASPDLLRQARWARQHCELQIPNAQPQRLLFDPAELDKQLDWAGTLGGEGGRMVCRKLKKAKALGPARSLSGFPSNSGLTELDRRFPHFAEVTEIIRQHATLCALAPQDGMHLPPILLFGPPGVGKSAYAAQLARLTDAPMNICDVASTAAEHALTGLDFGYESAKPGLVYESLDGPSMSPIIVLDEVDKPPKSTGVLGGLYRLLESHSACRFEDAAVPLRIDASRITWLATCNDPSQLDKALLSRFEVAQIRQPSAAEMSAVIESVNADLLAGRSWAQVFEPELPPGLVDQLAGLSPRLVRRALQAAYARAATQGRRRLTADDVPKLQTECTRPFGFLA